VVLGFGMGELADCVPEQITVAFKPQVNTFRGESSLQMLIEHIPESLNPGLSDILDENEAARAAADEEKLRELGIYRAPTQKQEKLEINPGSRPELKVVAPLVVGAEAEAAPQDMPVAKTTAARQATRRAA